MVMDIKIGQTLSMLMKQKRMSLTEISKNTKVPVSTISEWLSNRTPKNPVQVSKVSKFLSVSLHFLLFGEEDSSEPIQRIIKNDIFQGTFEITLRKVKIEGENE